MTMGRETAEGKPTWVSWPVRAAKSATADRVPSGRGLRRKVAVYPWTPPPEDPIDEETGEPRVWQPGHVRTWIREAMETLRRLPIPAGELPGGLRSRMPAVVHQMAEAYGYDSRPARKPVTTEEIGRLDLVLDWLFLLGERPGDRQDAVVVTALALGLNLRAAGRLVGRSHEWCRQREKAALARIAERLNSDRRRRKARAGGHSPLRG